MQNYIQEEIQKVPAFDAISAELQGGVTVSASDLYNGSVIKGGTAVGKDTNGLYHVIKSATATTAAAAADTTLVVSSDNQFKVGDFIAKKAGSQSATITAIVTNTETGTSTFTLDVAIGAVSVVDVLVQAKAKASSAVLAYVPVGLTKEAKYVKSGDNIFVGIVLIGVAREWVTNLTPSDVKSSLGTIKFLS